MITKDISINALGAVEFAPDVRIIPDYAFSGEENLRIVHIPEHILQIGYRAFENCRNLEVLTFSEGLKSVEMEAFLNCSSLKKVVLPDSVEEFGNHAFYGSGITEPVYNTGHTILFYYPDKLEETYFEIPSTVREIMATTFGPNPWLKEVYLPKGVRQLHPNTFSNSYLKRVVIPESVHQLRFCFQNCPDLQEVILEGKTDLQEAFEKCPNVKTVRKKITAGQQLYDLYSPFADLEEISLPADTSYQETGEFIRLSEELARKNVAAMHRLSLFFWELHFRQPHEFYVWAAQFWAFRHALHLRQRRVPADILPEVWEYEYGEKLLEGRLLFYLGLTWFDLDRVYRFHRTDNPHIVLVSSPCVRGKLLEQYDNTDLDGKDRFDWQYLDSRYLSPLGEQLCRYSFYEPAENSPRFLEAGMRAVRQLLTGDTSSDDDSKDNPGDCTARKSETAGGSLVSVVEF